jgi:histidyl-tRNA synthetase
MVHDAKSLKSQMRTAERFNASCVVIAGEEELNKDRIIIRDMKRHEQKEVSVEDMVSQVRRVAEREHTP